MVLGCQLRKRPVVAAEAEKFENVAREQVRHLGCCIDEELLEMMLARQKMQLNAVVGRGESGKMEKWGMCFVCTLLILDVSLIWYSSAVKVME